jgi:hypothetical protein
MKRVISSIFVAALAAPALAQEAPLIGESSRTQKLPSLAEARDCAAATGYWVILRRTAKQPSKIYETSLKAWSGYIQKQTNEPETKVQADIMADVQSRAKNRDSSWALKSLIACSVFERAPAPPSALADQPAP